MKVKEIFEELFEKKLETTLLEMANIGVKHTGISNVVIWVGMDPQQHYLRVKVSNVPDKWASDNFTITVPELVVVGKVNKVFITERILADIKNWIKLNMNTIEAYEKGEIVYTDEFLSMLKKI